MNGIDIGNFSGADHLGDVQVALAAPRRADAHRLICKPHVQRVAISLGVDRDRGNAQLLAGADDPQGNFPAIGD